MDGAFDIPDSSDWLDTPLKDFSDLENALHCDICKEFYETPMITSCCHTFCSKCIRTCLSTNGKCPACQAADQASRLRNNWLLQTVVDKFVSARPAAIEVARREREQAEQTKKPGKRKRAILDSDDVEQAEQDGRTTRSKTRRLAASQTSQSDPIEIDDSDEDEDFKPDKEPPEDGRIECLLGCGKRIKPEEMGVHIDVCEDERKQASTAKSRTPVNNLSSRPQSAQNHRSYEKIGELSYSLFTDAKLRQKLKDAGIPNWGSKQLMIKRHTEWVNLWNANCDSGGKRSKIDLLNDLDRWERTQGGRAPNPNGLSSTIMRKDFDGVGWANSNKQDFSRLIADAKRKKSNPAIEEGRAKDVGSAEAQSSVTLPASSSQLRPPSQMDKPANPLKPYENNEEATTSIRAKVQAANNDRHIEPDINTNVASVAMRDETNTTSNGGGQPRPPADIEQPALLEENRFGRSRGSGRGEHPPNQETGLQADLQSSPIKLPMFAVPERPVSDLCGAGGGTGEM